MGITASVMCNCYRDGKTTPCPYPHEFIADPHEFPTLEWQSQPDEITTRKAYAELHEWLLTCCEHPNMNAALEFIASWKSYQTFSDLLDTLDKEHFPHLNVHLPDGEDGITPPEVAPLILEEIQRFEQMQSKMTQAVLVDSERDDVISMGSQVLNGTLAMDRVSGFDIGFTEEGFFVRDRWELNRVVFSAKRLEQRLLRPEEMQVEYVDLESGRSFVCNTPFGKAFTGEDGLPRMYLQFFQIEQRPLSENRFAYILEPLKRVCKASIETNNPIRWH
jgi:hypothetical protein